MNIDPVIITVATGASVGLTALLGWAASKIVIICDPNEVLVFSGRKHQSADGHSLGFRVVRGGRAVRVPILEKVERMDMSLISVPMEIRGAYSKGGIPLNLSAVANVKIDSQPSVIGNAIERFLGHSRAEIGRVAKETLEGHLRGVLATMTPEEVNEDRLKFADRLTEEAGDDLRKLGLQLDTLKIQHVSDERSYLDSIGRKRIAEIVAAAEVAESDAVRAAEEAEATERARSGVAQQAAVTAVQRVSNELRRVKAELDALAASEEQQAEQAALAAQAQAEVELQVIRGELETLRNTADVVVPAEIERRVRELLAEGKAAAIAENGKAVAQALSAIHDAWQSCGEHAMDIVMVQQLDELFAEAAEAAKHLRPSKVSLLDGGEGRALTNYARAYPATVRALVDEIAGTFGVDLPRLLGGARASAGTGTTHVERPAA